MHSESIALTRRRLPRTNRKLLVKDRDDGDIVDSGMAEHFDPIPEFKSWFGSGNPQRAMAVCYVDTAKRDFYGPVARSFITSDESAAHGQYCLCYTLSPSLPMNETCMQILGWPPTPEAIQGSSATKRNFRRGRALSKCPTTHQTQYLSVGYQMYPKLFPSSLLLCGRILRKSIRSVSLHAVNKGRLRGNRTNEKPTLNALNGESVDNGLN